jgi:TonB family protein
MTINESGKVDSATVVRTSHEAFGLAAKEVAMKWEFIPAMKNGKPIRTVVMVPFKFALSGDDEFFGLITFATDILQKKKVAQKAETMIDPEAYAIVGHKYVLLRSVLFDRNPQATLVEGEKTEVLFSSLKSDEAKSSVVLTLKTGTSKTKGIRFHTIVFMKSSDGTWKIKSWHASE